MIFDQHNYTGRPQDLVRFDVIIYDEDRDFNRTAKRDIENVAWSTSINFNKIKTLTNTIKLKKNDTIYIMTSFNKQILLMAKKMQI